MGILTLTKYTYTFYSAAEQANTPVCSTPLDLERTFKFAGEGTDDINVSDYATLSANTPNWHVLLVRLILILLTSQILTGGPNTTTQLVTTDAHRRITWRKDSIP
jgi:hypothetical protein